MARGLSVSGSRLARIEGLEVAGDSRWSTYPVPGRVWLTEPEEKSPTTGPTGEDDAMIYFEIVGRYF